MIAIPVIDNKSGDSFDSINQLRAAPETGIRNFHLFNIETLIPGRFNNEYHMEKAAAERKLNQDKDR